MFNLHHFTAPKLPKPTGHTKHDRVLGHNTRPGQSFKDSRGRVYTRDRNGTVRCGYTYADGRPR